MNNTVYIVNVFEFWDGLNEPVPSNIGVFSSLEKAKEFVDKLDFKFINIIAWELDTCKYEIVYTLRP